MLYYAVLILFTFYHHLLILIPSFHMNYTIMEFDLLISTMFPSTLLFCCFLTSNVTLCGSPPLEVKITGLAVIYRSEPTPRALQLGWAGLCLRTTPYTRQGMCIQTNSYTTKGNQD